MRELREREIFWAIPIRFRLKQGRYTLPKIFSTRNLPRTGLVEIQPVSAKKSNPGGSGQVCGLGGFLPTPKKNHIQATCFKATSRGTNTVMTLMTLQFMKSHGWRTTPKQELN